MQKTRECIKGMLGQKAETLIKKLNPIVRGWTNYHRHVCAADAFRLADHIVQRQLLRWAQRTHPKKSRGWLIRKYFRAQANGAFSVRIASRTGESRVLALHRIAKTVIERHIKVRGEANPYDPVYTEYFERRRCFAWRTLPCRGASKIPPADV